jgi:hypothetical protein
VSRTPAAISAISGSAGTTSSAVSTTSTIVLTARLGPDIGVSASETTGRPAISVTEWLRRWKL